LRERKTRKKETAIIFVQMKNAKMKKSKDEGRKANRPNGSIPGVTGKSSEG